MTCFYEGVRGMTRLYEGVCGMTCLYFVFGLDFDWFASPLCLGAGFRLHFAWLGFRNVLGRLGELGGCFDAKLIHILDDS